MRCPDPSGASDSGSLRQEGLGASARGAHCPPAQSAPRRPEEAGGGCVCCRLARDSPGWLPEAGQRPTAQGGTLLAAWPAHRCRLCLLTSNIGSGGRRGQLLGRASGAGRSVAESPVDVPQGQPHPPCSSGDTSAAGQSQPTSRPLPRVPWGLGLGAEPSPGSSGVQDKYLSNECCLSPARSAVSPAPAPSAPTPPAHSFILWSGQPLGWRGAGREGPGLGTVPLGSDSRIPSGIAFWALGGASRLPGPVSPYPCTGHHATYARRSGAIQCLVGTVPASGDQPSVARGEMGLRDLGTALPLKPLLATPGREDVAQTLDVTHNGRFFTLGVPGAAGSFMRRGCGEHRPRPREPWDRLRATDPSGLLNCGVPVVCQVRDWPIPRPLLP